MLSGTERAVAQFQRASIVIRRGDEPGAARELDAAIRALARGRATMYEAHARTNRGLLRTYEGEFASAREDLERARTLYVALGMTMAAAVALHNLAFLDGRAGDVIGALDPLSTRRARSSAYSDSASACWTSTAATRCSRPGCRPRRLQRATEASAALRADGSEFEVPEAQLVAAVASERCGDR